MQNERGLRVRVRRRLGIFSEMRLNANVRVLTHRLRRRFCRAREVLTEGQNAFRKTSFLKPLRRSTIWHLRRWVCWMMYIYGVVFAELPSKCLMLLARIAIFNIDL